MGSTEIRRREFLKTAAVGAAALAGGVGPVRAALSRAKDGPDWLDADVPQLQAWMASGALTSHELTKGYLRRIDRLNPLLGAVIETNPQAIGIAARRDAERRRGIVRGPLHGIPVLIKDNIASDDRMETTAGSYALEGSRVPGDAVLVHNLRKAGAVLLGKANLSEWANFRGFPPPDFPFATNFLNGWSGRGGFTFDPYLLSFDPCGSSSGSAVGPAANLCAVAVGTETDGSITCPAGNNLVVGLKPTVGLVAQDGIIPIAHSQDTAGPMTRTVTDAAILLNALVSPFGAVAGHSVPRDYTVFLDEDALRGARIGVDRRQFLPEYFALPDINAEVDRAIGAMADAGAVIIDPVDPGDPFSWFDAEFFVLLNEFKGDIAAYLSGLRKTSMRTLSDLIEFNREHCLLEMRFFGQEIFEISESLSGDLHDPDYVAARALCLELGRDQGIDRALAEDDLDAIVSPSYAFGTSGPAVAGYPLLSVPVGISSEGRPAGIWLSGGFLSEPTLLAIGYALEQILDARSQPTFAGEVPPDPPDAGICDALEEDEEARETAALTVGRKVLAASARRGRPAF
ncbi:MAG TPA: amidase family protein [Actinomycetota bacterium]